MKISKKAGLVALALSAVLLGSALVAGRNSSEAAAVPSGSPEVRVAKPVLRTVNASRRYPAMIEAVDRVALHAQVSGYLERVSFQEGALVRQGDILFQIDSRLYRARLADAEAALAIARAEADLARNESARALRLIARSAIPAEEAERRMAQAAVARAKVRAAEAALDNAQLNVEFSEIRAPFDGRIGRAHVTRGNLVTPEDELAVIVATDRLHVRFDMNESEFARLNPYAAGDWRVNFSVDKGGETIASGPVTIIDNEVRAGTGTVRIRARLEVARRPLIHGMFGNAEVVFGERHDALLIDEKAIGTSQGKRYVLVVNGQNTLEYRPVTLGAVHSGMRQVESGLSTQDRVVVGGLMQVRPGALVTPVEVPMVAVAETLLPSRVDSGS
jgi:membrane fusion protein, multidrug efflux system